MCNTFFLMGRVASTVVLLILPALAATDPSQGSNGVFEAYHEAISVQMTAMLSRTPVPESQPGRGDAAPTAGSLPAKPSDTAVREFANRYWRGHEDSLRKALARLGPIRPSVERILESEGLPKNLIAVVLVESAADPLALSAKQARGLWQIIPETGRLYGLTVSPQQDDRIHTERATRAAARLLRDLYTEFRDWPLALAAYNSGRQTVELALQKARHPDFWTISSAGLLPDETRNYVPAVLSAMQLFGNVLSDSGQSVTHGASHPEWVYASTGATD